MVNSITNLSSAKEALIEAVNAVTKDNNGANDRWLESLKKKADTDKNGEAQKKVTTLQFFDGVLRSSINPNLSNEEELGRLVSEIQGYQVLTERFISELGDLTGTDQPLEEKAAKERSNLFKSLNDVQNWLLTQNKRSSPSEFDACTNQFLAQMQLASRELDLTQQLFNDQSPELREFDPQNLTDAWGTVVSSFVEDAQDTNEDDALNIGASETIGSFFCIHERLETLYGRLGANVSLVN
ncbi:MAG: hypothetical protein LH702_28130 [Phormidesmis sp. CAN_BIN44]|nr:hypothetical protein [Phormidesmis sp. CAN_BIN44]